MSHQPTSPQPAEPHTQYVGHTVVDESDHEIGKIVDVVYDNDGAGAGSPDELPGWLVVDPGLMRAAHWMPVTGTYRSSSGSVVAPWDRELVKHAPKADGDHLLTDELRRALAAHYELDVTG